MSSPQWVQPILRCLNPEDKFYAVCDLSMGYHQLELHPVHDKFVPKVLSAPNQPLAPLLS